jgi:Primase C terminal 1 (PriCT-1)
MLSADPGYHGPLVQNPLNCRWRKIVTDERYGLCDLAGEIPKELLQPERAASERQLGAISSRNCHLFEAIRRISYSEVKRARDRKEFHQRMLDVCRRENVYRPALPDSEIQAIARSIARWTWERRDTIGSHWRRGVLRLGPIVEQGEMREHAIRVRQQAGAEYARARRTLTLKSEIKAAVDQLSGEGKKVTVAAIARWARVSRNSVYGYLRKSQSESHTEGLFSDVQQNEHFQDNPADPSNLPGASHFAMNGAAGAAAGAHPMRIETQGEATRRLPLLN